MRASEVSLGAATSESSCQTVGGRSLKICQSPGRMPGKKEISNDRRSQKDLRAETWSSVQGSLDMRSLTLQADRYRTRWDRGSLTPASTRAWRAVSNSFKA